MAALGEKLASAVERRWYSKPGWLYCLYPLEVLFSFVARRRKQQYINAQSRARPSIPVVVIGNVTVGGTGKTPTIIAITLYLQSLGKKVGVVSRGYGRKSKVALVVDENTTLDQAGDEPFLIYSRTHCFVAVAEDRLDAIALLEASGCDVILADDGMQHYRMHRDFEVLLVDGARGFGNGHQLPVGPLRELPDRCASVDWVLINGKSQHHSIERWLLKPYQQRDDDSSSGVNVESIGLSPVSLTNLASGDLVSLDFLRSLRNVVAVAGIGNPQRFFATLKNLGVAFSARIFADHHWFQATDFDGLQGAPVIMTEKDAVKCQKFAKDNWFQLNVEMVISVEWLKAFNHAIDRCIDEKSRVNGSRSPHSDSGSIK
ncbi:Tetraacyldisaccharide 4'-kinase [Thalassocella blandensis]|nr:Tetraacyldisaccharide 4'-kinase [Thalassocella blandensis]